MQAEQQGRQDARQPAPRQPAYPYIDQACIGGMQKDVRETVDKGIVSKKVAFQKIGQMHKRLVLPEIKIPPNTPNRVPTERPQKRILRNILGVIEAQKLGMEERPKDDKDKGEPRDCAQRSLQGIRVLPEIHRRPFLTDRPPFLGITLGLSPFTKDSFCLRGRVLILFSSKKAGLKFRYRLCQTSFTGLLSRVYLAPLPLLCSPIRLFKHGV